MVLRVHSEMTLRGAQLRDKESQNQLQVDLVEQIWARFGNNEWISYLLFVEF